LFIKSVFNKISLAKYTLPLKRRPYFAVFNKARSDIYSEDAAQLICQLIMDSCPLRLGLRQPVAADIVSDYIMCESHYVRYSFYCLDGLQFSHHSREIAVLKLTYKLRIERRRKRILNRYISIDRMKYEEYVSEIA